MKEYLKKLLAAKQAKQAEMTVLYKKSADSGETPSEEDATLIATLKTEIDTIAANIANVQTLIADAENAGEDGTPVEGGSEAEAKSTAQGKKKTIITTESNLPAGIGFAQFARAKILSQIEMKSGNFKSALDIAKERGFSPEVQDLVQKATLGTTTDAGFAASLVHENRLVGEFVEMLRVATVFDKLKGMRNVPFNSKIPSQLTGGAAQWVGEGAKKPLTNPTFGDVEVKEHKLAAITVYTQELMRRSDPAVDVLIRDDLIEASKALIDTTFLGVQAQSNTTPIGIFNGVAGIVSTGVTAAAYEADLLSLISAFVGANLTLDGAYFVMSETRAAQLSLLRDALGNTYFDGMSLRGDRTLMGVPVITSQTVTDKIGLIKTSEILLAQDGGVDVSYSDQATLVDGATTHNLWQENKFAVRVEKFITWAKRRPIASAFISYAAP